MIVLGRIVAPYGVRGWVKVRPFGDDPESWGEMTQWWLSAATAGGDAGEDWRPVPLEAFRPHASGWIAKLAGVDDRDAAEQIDGCFVGAPRQDLPPTGHEEFYWADLIGLAVVTESEESLGKVSALVETGAHPVLVVQDGETERLLPFVEAVVKAVDVAGGRITVAWDPDW